jgi:hypothetical protein
MLVPSDKRSAAARANGALSHGPKTPEGKARSAQNARTHGLLSSIVTLRCEDKEAFDAMLASYIQRYQPADGVEMALVEELTAAAWRHRRTLAIETHMLDVEMEARTTSPTQLDRLTGAFGDLAATPKLNLVHRYLTKIHNMESRLMRDFVILRHAIPIPDSPQPETIEVTPEPAPPLPEPVPADNAPMPNEPKTPLPTNKSVSSIRVHPCESVAKSSSRRPKLRPRFPNLTIRMPRMLCPKLRSARRADG